MTNTSFTNMAKFRVKGQLNRFHTCSGNSTVTGKGDGYRERGGIRTVEAINLLYLNPNSVA